MLIRNILEGSVQKFGEVKAVKWLNRKEISERSYYEMMKNSVGDEFTLVYSEETKSTSIKKGYFQEL